MKFTTILKVMVIIASLVIVFGCSAPSPTTTEPTNQNIKNDVPPPSPTLDSVTVN